MKKPVYWALQGAFALGVLGSLVAAGGNNEGPQTQETAKPKIKDDTVFNPWPALGM